MKNNLKFAFLTAIFAVVLTCSANAFAQTGNVPMVGGFKPVAVTDRGVVEATNFAVKTIAQQEEMELKLDSILKAEYQVVQGMNYKISFRTLYSDGGEVYELCLNARVYRNLKNVYSLTSWDSSPCSEEDQ